MNGLGDNQGAAISLANGSMLLHTSIVSPVVSYHEFYKDKLYFAPNLPNRLQYGILIGGVTLYGRTDFHRIDTLSISKWKIHGKNIIRILTKSLSDASAIIQMEKQKNENVDPETIIILRELYGKLDDGVKSEFISKYKNTKFEKILTDKCVVCGIFYETGESKKRCIHPSCTEMCEYCHDSWRKFNECESKGGSEYEKCPSCKQEQSIECPICLEATTKEDVLKSETCDHSICVKCFGMSHYKNVPITKCPLCRSIFSS